MRSFRILQAALVVLLVLTFSFSTVAAQAPVLQDAPPELIPSVDSQTDIIVDPYPISPSGDNYVYTNLPKYYFSLAQGFTKYQIEVYDLADTLVFAFKGEATCTSSLCWLQPDKKVRPFSIYSDVGRYEWRVRAIPAGDWSNRMGFVVLSSGFKSTFDVNTNKWLPVSGDWTHQATKGYYKTLGETGLFSSANSRDYFTNNVVYEVRMKRKVESGLNAIIFQGLPEPLSADGNWKSGYYFQYNNDGYWSLIRYQNNAATTLVIDTFSPFINQYGWNTLTVWRQGGYIYLWINNAFVDVVYDTTFLGGQAGFGMFETDADPSPLLVDYARLSYSAISTYAIPPGE